MTQRTSLAYLAIIVVVVVLPTAISLGWYHISKDPNLRPLGITEQALRKHEGGSKGLEIVALVEWVQPRTARQTQAQLELALTRAFQAKGAEVRVVFREGRDVTRITYIVGTSSLGPFPIARASEGVESAVQAFHMY